MNYSNLSIEERCCIREYCNSGKSFREIASLIGRSPATISREINRNKSYMDCKPAYYPSTAQKKYKYRRRFCHRDMFGNEELVKYIEINFCSLGLGTNCKYSLRIRRSFVQNDKALSHLPNEMAKSITCDRGQRICELAKHREKTKLRDVFCRSVLCVAKRHKRKQQRTLERFLPLG